jgi:hypothetical protein
MKTQIYASIPPLSSQASPRMFYPDVPTAQGMA